jgi:hypothetical protein
MNSRAFGFGKTTPHGETPRFKWFAKAYRFEESTHRFRNPAKLPVPLAIENGRPSASIDAPSREPPCATLADAHALSW